MGEPRLGRRGGRRRPAGSRQRVRHQQLALQQQHGRQGAPTPHGARPHRRRRRPLGQDHHLRAQSRACDVHRRAVQPPLPGVRRALRPRHRSLRHVSAEPARRLRAEGQGAAHRDLRGHARYRHRHSRGGQPGLLQTGLLADQVLADDRARHAPVPRSVRTRGRQARLPRLRLLLQLRLLPGAAGGHRGPRRRAPPRPALSDEGAVADRHPGQAGPGPGGGRWPAR